MGDTIAAATTSGRRADSVPRVVIRRALPTEYDAIDRLVTEAYAHDYGPSDRRGDAMARSEYRDREFEVWVAVESEDVEGSDGSEGAEGSASPSSSGLDRAVAPRDGVGGLGGGDGVQGAVRVDTGGELLGSVTLRTSGGAPLHEDFGADELDLRLLAVSPRTRRRGVGAALMRQAEVRAAVGGFAAVGLKTQPEMLGAHRLYESLGYVRAPERDGLWIDGRRVLDLFTYLLPLR